MTNANRSSPPVPRSRGAVLLACWRLKFLAPVIGLSAFFFVYFQVMAHPLWPVTTVPRLPLDRWVPFQPAWMAAYVSLWPYLLVAPGVMDTLAELWRYYAGIVVLAVIGLAIFVLWPTATPPSDIDWAHYPSVAFLKHVDSAGNACPSLHAAFVVFTAIWNQPMLRRFGDRRGALRVISVLWAVAILYSTLATRQHVILDLLAGGALGAIVAIFHRRWWRHHHLVSASLPSAVGVAPQA